MNEALHSCLKYRRCCIHPPETKFEIVRGSGQYLYDAQNNQYLDCINSVAHVGHGNPSVTQATVQQMSFLTETFAPFEAKSPLSYPSQLKETLPSSFDSFLFCNSGTEAVDLAIQIARQKTQATEVICIENSFHGATESVRYLSSKIHNENEKLPDWVHIIPSPRSGGEGTEDEFSQSDLSVLTEILEKLNHEDRKIACFICEPFLAVTGCMIPSKSWLQKIYKLVRAAGGVCIADEVQTGFGRVGSHFWSFEAQQVVPDIVIIGKSAGNGYPFSTVATSASLSCSLGDRVKAHRCSPIVNSVGCSVLSELKKKALMRRAFEVGTQLKMDLLRLKDKHRFIGDVRGQGLLFGVEIVSGRHAGEPSAGIARKVVLEMLKKRILLANEGRKRNILLLMPPMCFGREDARRLTQSFDQVLNQLADLYPSEELPPDLGQGEAEVGRIGHYQHARPGDPLEAKGSLGPRSAWSYDDLD